MATQASDFVRIYSFAKSKPVLYHGDPLSPKDEIFLNDPRLEDFYCLRRMDWMSIRAKLATVR